MITFQTNENNDIFIGKNGNLAISSDLQALIQSCEQAMKAQAGELVLNTTRGIPTMQTAWGGSPNVAQFEAFSRRALLSVNGVIDASVSASTAGDTLRYTATIRTIYGEVQIGV